MPAYFNETNKSWYAKFDYTDWQGTHKQKLKRGFTRKKDAVAFEREFIKKQKADLSMNFETFVKLYLDELRSRIRETTFSNKQYLINSKIIPFFKNKSINEIKTSDIRKWQNTLLKSNYSETYIKTVNNQLTAIFNYAVKYYDLSINPCKKAGSIGKKHSDKQDFWTVDDFNKVISIINDDDVCFKTLFSTLYWTGMRIGEALALTKSDIDIEKRTININKSFSRINKEDLITPPKTPKSNRKISIHKELADLLNEYINKLPYLADDERLFNLSKVTARQSLYKYAKKAGVKQIRIHDLRHSHASLLVELGFSTLLIAQRLGHEKIETTLQIYSHLFPNKEEELINTIENLIDSKNNTF